MEFLVWRNNTVAERSTLAEKINVSDDATAAATALHEVHANNANKNADLTIDLALGMERPQNNNKREEASNKLSDRYLIGQAIKNPFLVENDYLQDLEVQHNFLMPKKAA
jgi:hypothetical protein